MLLNTLKNKKFKKPKKTLEAGFYWAGIFNANPELNANF